MTTTNYPRWGTIPTMPPVVTVLNATAVILIIVGLVTFLASLVPSVETHNPRLRIGALTVLLIGLGLGLVLFVLESAY